MYLIFLGKQTRFKVSYCISLDLHQLRRTYRLCRKVWKFSATRGGVVVALEFNSNLLQREIKRWHWSRYLPISYLGNGLGIEIKSKIGEEMVLRFSNAWITYLLTIPGVCLSERDNALIQGGIPISILSQRSWDGAFCWVTRTNKV